MFTETQNSQYKPPVLMFLDEAHRLHCMPSLIFPCHWTPNCIVCYHPHPKHKYLNIQSCKTLHCSQEHPEVGGNDLYKGKLLCTLDISLQSIAGFMITFPLSIAKLALSLSLPSFPYPPSLTHRTWLLEAVLEWHPYLEQVHEYWFYQ